MRENRISNVPTLAGWMVTILFGAAVYLFLTRVLGFFVPSSVGFGLAASLFLLLLLTGSRQVENGAPKVRRIVPQPERVIEEPVLVTGPASVTPSEPRVVPTRVSVERAPEGEGEAAPAGPRRMDGPRWGKADDLTVIEGIGPVVQEQLNALGIYHLDQIARWSDADVAAIDAELGRFKGRIVRDRWVSQAKIILTEGIAEFRLRAKTKDY